jgi:hypothetical protein
MQSTAAYRRRDGWYVQSNSKTTVGVYISSPPFLKVPLNPDAAELGRAVLAALMGLRTDVPHPTEFANSSPALKLAGVKSWTAFERGATHVGLHADDKSLSFCPSRSAGPRSGFLYGASGLSQG